MNLIRPAKVISYALLGIALSCIGARAQGVVVDTMALDIVPPDSVYVKLTGSHIVVGWYPASAARSSVTGSRDFVNWYVNDPEVSHVDITGIYSGSIDRMLTVERVITGQYITRERVGQSASINMLAEIQDRGESYFKEFNLGLGHYTPGDTIPMILIGRSRGDTLDTGVGLVFHDGVVDTAFAALAPFFEIDLQTYEGFHVWRGLSPYPSHMTVITELSREDAHVGVTRDSIYFAEWPKIDSRGRQYCEFTDENAFIGFTYYYIVSCFDKGYFKGKFLFNKRDNFICDEDLEHPETPGHPVNCSSVAKVITKTVRAGTDMMKIYAVPNPYRTGTSAVTLPYYHNFPDGNIKFFNVPKEADLKIYTVSGDLVWETHHSSPSGDNGIISWNVKNKKGQEVGSGVYIYRCKNSAGTDMYGRIVVIR